MTTTLNQPPADALQHRYATRVKARLAKPRITLPDARDAMLDCFIATYYQGVATGVDKILDIRGGEEQIVKLTASLFEQKLARHNATFQAPTVDALRAVKDEVDAELHFEELPAELRGVHDQVCTLLLSKAEGALPHNGAHSVVTTRASAGTGATQSIGPSASRLPAPATPPSATPSPPTTPATPATPTAPTTPAAVTQLRSAFASYLVDFADAINRGDPAGALRDRLTAVDQLLSTLVTLERAG